MAKSTKSRGGGKPAKPYAEFPLFPHATGRWAKKVRGKLQFFGRWGHSRAGTVIAVDDVKASAMAALEEYNRQAPYLADGRTPPLKGEETDACTLKTLCNAFWRSKKAKLDAGELSHRSFADYKQTTDLLIGAFGKDRRIDDLRPVDFESLRSSLAVRLGCHSLKNTVNRCRVVFKFAVDQGMIDKPVSYGQSFDRPTAKAMRKARNAAGARMFQAAEVRMILSALDGKPVSLADADEPVTMPADPVVKAMVLLGMNCGFGNTDCATLPRSAVDLGAGWIDFPRPKTEIQRRVPLWPETVAALRDALAVRPKAESRAFDDRVFLTGTGRPFVRVQAKQDDADKTTAIDVLSQKFARILHRLKINGRTGLNFYTLRHVFETVGGRCRDQVAVDACMGHADSSMAAAYREGIDDDRLQAVVFVVRAWLWPDRGEARQ